MRSIPAPSLRATRTLTGPLGSFGRSVSERWSVLKESGSLLRVTSAGFVSLLCWVKLGLGHTPSWRTLLRSEVHLRHVLLIFLVYQAWSLPFRFRATLDGRAMARLQYLRMAASTTIMASTLATSLLGAAKLFGFDGALRPFSLLFFWTWSTAWGLAYVLMFALLYQAIYLLLTPQTSIIVGSRRRAISLFKSLTSNPQRRARILGFLDSDNSHSKYLPGDYLGSVHDLERLLSTQHVDTVYIALPLRSHHGEAQQAIWTCERAGVNCICSPEVFDSMPKRSVEPPAEVARITVREHEVYPGLSTSRLL